MSQSDDQSEPDGCDAGGKNGSKGVKMFCCLLLATNSHASHEWNRAFLGMWIGLISNQIFSQRNFISTRRCYKLFWKKFLTLLW